MIHHLVILTSIQEQLFITLRDYQIKNRNNISWVVLNLSVELLIIGVNMTTINIKYIRFCFFNLLQLFYIEWLFSKVFCLIIDVHVSVDKVPYLVLQLVSINGCSPNKLLSCTRWFLSVSHIVEHSC
jgi:hypothetical protein